ncbi:unnamed protein product, partial [Prorocentrum cordatum]
LPPPSSGWQRAAVLTPASGGRPPTAAPRWHRRPPRRGRAPAGAGGPRTIRWIIEGGASHAGRHSRSPPYKDERTAAGVGRRALELRAWTI